LFGAELTFVRVKVMVVTVVLLSYLHLDLSRFLLRISEVWTGYLTISRTLRTGKCGIISRSSPRMGTLARRAASTCQAVNQRVG